MPPLSQCGLKNWDWPAQSKRWGAGEEGERREVVTNREELTSLARRGGSGFRVYSEDAKEP